MERILFSREILNTSLANILDHKFRSLLTILGIIIGIVTIVLVASVLVGVRMNIISLFQGLGTDNIFAYHLNRDPGSTRLQPEELTLRPLKPEFAPILKRECSSLKDTAVQLYVPNIVTGRAQSFESHLLMANNEALVGAGRHRHGEFRQTMRGAAIRARKMRMTLRFTAPVSQLEVPGPLLDEGAVDQPDLHQ